MAVAFAERMQFLRASEIREILKITQRPEVISFAGGLPAPEVFPVAELQQVMARVLAESGRQALQYSTTEGFDDLRRLIAARLGAKFAVDVAANDILITHGSQQAIDLAARLYLNKDDVVLCESPTYLAAISAFKAYQPRFVEVPTDEYGMDIVELEKILRTLTRVKLIYIIPDFQNPTGRTWSLERRRQFAGLMAEYEIPVVEDNPYGELRFEGEMLPAVKAFDTKGLVTFVSTFSKTMCPGMRLGWLTAAPELLEKYVLLKQGMDLHTSSLSQWAAAKFLETFDYDAHINKIIDIYKDRRDVMISALEEYFPAEAKFTRPQGGLFTWVELPGHINAALLLRQSLAFDVAFVPGDSFFPNGGVTNTLRLNYSNMPPEKIREGIRRLAAAIESYPERRAPEAGPACRLSS
jgi:2-aminoadipate transaminase